MAAAALVLLGWPGPALARADASATVSSVTAPRIHSFRPARRAAGTKATITGTGFRGVRTVRFAGAAAAFRVRSSSRITAVVSAMPSGAVPDQGHYQVRDG